MVFIADDEASAETVLQDADVQYTMRPVLTIRMENQPSAGAATFRKLANAGRLPQQALDRIVARCDMTLYDRQSPGHAADGGGREGARGRCAADPDAAGRHSRTPCWPNTGSAPARSPESQGGQARHLPSGTGVTHRGIENLRRLESGRNRGYRLRSRPRRPRHRAAQPTQRRSRWQAARSSAGFH